MDEHAAHFLDHGHHVARGLAALFDDFHVSLDVIEF